MGLQQYVQSLAQESAQHKRHISYAKVIQVDHKRNRAKVQLMPEGNITGFLRIANAYVGDGWTMHFPVFKDDEVLVEFPSGQLASGIITWRLHNEIDRWPNSDKFPEQLRKCSYRDVFLLHKSGSYLRFFGEQSKNSKDGQHKPNNDGDITMRARGKGCIRVEADSRLELVAPEIRVRKPHDQQSPFVLSEWVDEWNGFVKRFNGHKHILGGGIGTSGTPIYSVPIPEFPERSLLKPTVCDMHTQGVPGW